MKHDINLTVNGELYNISVQSHHTLLQVLRDQLVLTGTKNGCSEGECGACTVLIDGEPVNSCLVLAVEAGGHEITTVEGLATDGHLAPIQQTIVDLGGTQCGFCTPGILIAAQALLQRNPDPSEREIREGLVGNLCRCTGYVRIIDAVREAGRLQRASGVNSNCNDSTGMKAESRPIAFNRLLHITSSRFTGKEQTMAIKKTTIVGQSFPRVESNAKVTGAAQYVDDMQFGAHLLYGRLKRSTMPHAWIKSIDVSKAKALPGVRVVVTGQDYPGLTGLYLSDRPTFAVDRVRFIGEPVAGVAADTPELAEQACELIEIEVRGAAGRVRPGVWRER